MGRVGLDVNQLTATATLRILDDQADQLEVEELPGWQRPELRRG
jgi:hypothetical protein